jgi:uncharacterized protein involved in propanediol utilization
MASVYFDADPERFVVTPETGSLPLNPNGSLILRKFVRAWREKDYKNVFRAVSDGAILGYEWNPRPCLSRLAELAHSEGFGVFAAYTGTILGAICEPYRADEVRALIMDHCRMDAGQIFTERFS